MTAPLWLASFLHDDRPVSGRLVSGRTDAVTDAVTDAANVPHAQDAVADPDRPFVARIVQGDETAFKAAWEQYHDRLVAFAERYVRSSDVAADVVQHVFFMVWRDRTSLAPRGTFANYLYAAVRHRAWNVIKHDRIVQRHAEAQVAEARDLPDAASARNVGELSVEADELVAEAVRLLGTVAPRAREIFLMHREDELTPAQIAGVLGLSPQTVYNQLARVTRTLAEGLERWRQERG